MTKYWVVIILISIVPFSCDHADNTGRTVAYFKTHLHPGMSTVAIVKTFGKAEEDLGSGIHIYQYNLDDGTHVLIGCTDKIVYAKHVDPQQNLLETLL